AADYVRQVQHPAPLLDGLLYREGVAMLVGPAGLGKTAIAVDLALAIAAGDERWHGRRLWAHGRVVYLAAEGPAAVTQRLEAWAKHHQRVLPPDFIGVPMVESMATDKARAQLLDRLRIVRPVIVFVDTLAAATPGLKENDSEHA